MPDPTTVARIIAACDQIRAAWPHLEPAKDASLARRRPEPRRLGARSAAALDDTIRAERVDQVDQQRRGLVHLAQAPVPANLDAIEAERRAVATLQAACWLARSNLAGPDERDWWWSWPPLAPQMPDDHVGYLTVAVGHLSAPTAVAIAQDLAGVVRHLQRALGLGELWIPLVGRRCPCCGRRTLRASVSGPEVRGHVVECAGRPPCLCAGPDCACGRPGRVAGTAHLWTAGQLRQLGRPTRDAVWAPARTAVVP